MTDINGVSMGQRDDIARLADAFERLAEIETRLLALEQRLPAPDDRADLVLRAAWQALGPEAFTVRTLLDLATTPRRIALHAALTAYGLPVPFPANDRPPGRWLQRLVGHTVDGITLHHLGRTGAGAAYQLRSASVKHSKHPWDRDG